MGSLLGWELQETATDDDDRSSSFQGVDTALTVTGTVIDIEGVPVSNATVTWYDRYTTDEIAITNTDGGGQFRVDLPDREALYIVITATDSQDTRWFHVEAISPIDSDGQDTVDYGEFQLNRQLLAGPDQALTDEEPLRQGVTGAQEAERVYGVVSVWRWINPTEPTDQILYLEITETSMEPLDWGIPSNITQTTSNPEDNGMIKNIMPSVTVPHPSVLAAYTQLEGFDEFPGMVDTVALWEDIPNINTEPALDELFLQSWHPTREPELPAFAFSRQGGDDVGYRQYYGPELQEYLGPEADDEDLDPGEALEESAWRGLGLLPVVGNVLTLGDTLEWAGDIMRGLLGWENYPTSTTLLDAVPWPDRNHHNLVTQPWEGGASSVVLQVPLRFQPEYIDGDTVHVIVEAIWECDVPFAFLPTRPNGRIGRFTQEVTIGLNPPAFDETEENEVDGQLEAVREFYRSILDQDYDSAVEFLPYEFDIQRERSDYIELIKNTDAEYATNIDISLLDYDLLSMQDIKNFNSYILAVLTHPDAFYPYNPSQDFEVIDRGNNIQSLDITTDENTVISSTAQIARLAWVSPEVIHHWTEVPIDSPNEMMPHEICDEVDEEDHEADTTFVDSGTIDVSEYVPGSYMVFPWACDSRVDDSEGCDWLDPYFFRNPLDLSVDFNFDETDPLNAYILRLEIEIHYESDAGESTDSDTSYVTVYEIDDRGWYVGGILPTDKEEEITLG